MKLFYYEHLIELAIQKLTKLIWIGKVSEAQGKVGRVV